jgi:hypothetical protein
VRWKNQQGETVQAQGAAISKSPNQTIRGNAALLNPGRNAQKLLEDDFGIGPPC